MSTSNQELACSQGFHLECNFEACNLCQVLVTVDKELEAARETIRGLIQKRVILNSSRNVIHDQLCTKLPTEIVSQIFLTLVKEVNSHHSPPLYRNDFFCAPARLSSVCRRWREIAHSLPMLWTHVCIDVWRDPYQFAEEWFNRSGSLPLHITLYSPRDYKPLAWSSAAALVCKIVQSHSVRWQYLNIEWAEECILDTLFSHTEIMPESDTFHLRLGAYNTESLIHRHTPLQPGRFQSRNYCVYPKIPVERKNLTYLELETYGIQEVLKIISAAPILKRCDLLNLYSPSTGIATPVVHHCLQDLKLSFRDTFDNALGTDFLESITLPSLRRLHYNMSKSPFHNQSEHEFRGLKDFFIRSDLERALSIQTFTLVYHSSSSLDYNRNGFFHLTPVTHLIINSESSDIFESLLRKMAQDIAVFPYLQELQLSLSPNHDPTNNNKVIPSMGPSTCAVLCDFVEESNLEIFEGLESGTSKRSKDQLQYRRPFKTILIWMCSTRYQCQIAMTRDTFLRLRQAQSVGSLTVTFISTGDSKVDVFYDPRCLMDDECGDEFIVLQSLHVEW